MLGVFIMTIMGFLMYISAPALMAIFTPDELVQTYGANSLRIEAWAEPMFAASIVCYGVFVGAGDTLIPAIMNLGSMWVVRITLAAVLAPIMGLYGVWLAMCIELSFRGAIFIYRLLKGSWLNHTDRILDKV
jgi:Na+-driven multidrug efflux pump